MRLRRCFSLLLSFFMVIMLMPIAALADGGNASKAYAVLDLDGILTIGCWDTKPDGAYVVPNLSSKQDFNSIPWHGMNIKKVVFDSSIKNYKPTSLKCWFYECYDLVSVENANYLDTSSVTDMSDMFFNCYSLKILDLSSWDTLSVVSASSMFRWCSSLATLNVSNWNTSSVTDMSFMFDGCGVLETLDVSNWDTSSVTDMSEMFNNCYSLETLDLSSWDTSSVTDMSYMFDYCSSLTTLDVSNWDTSAVTGMIGMFRSCEVLETLDVSNWDTSSVTDMSKMFLTCYSLETLDLSSWDTSSVTDMSYMFCFCGALETLDVSNWDTSAVTNMAYMFIECSSLTTLDVSKWDTSSVTDMSYMFYCCGVLDTLDVSNWDTSAVTDMSFMFNGCGILEPLDVSNWDTSSVTNMGGLFGECHSLTTLDVSNWDTSAVTDMSFMFNGCGILEPLDVSNWDTSSVTNMGGLFGECHSLTTLDVSNWDTSSVTDMSGLFIRCYSLTTLDVSNWDTSAVTSVRDMFFGCEKPKELNVSSWDTSSVTDMSGLFNNCSSLTALDVSNWDTSAVTSVRDMFNGCENLKELNVSSWDTSSVTDMSGLFGECSSLITLDLTGWNLSSVDFDLKNYFGNKGISGMFNNCNKLKTIYVDKDWNLSDLVKENSCGVFMYCTSLIGGAGTAYSGEIYSNDSTWDVNFAQIDGGASNPGYFTSSKYYILSFSGGNEAIGEAPTRIFAESGDQIALPTAASLSRSGYEFIGWSDGRKTYIEGEAYSVGTEAVNFTAVWKCLHELTEVRDEKEATCTEDGYTGDTYCSVCEEMLEEGKVISSVGHIWNTDFTVDKKPTYTAEGSKSIHCTKCEAAKDVTVIPTLEPTNTPSPEPSGEPTPTNTPTPTKEASELSVGDFINRCYEVAFGREADEAGYNYWVDNLNNGQACGAQVGFGFIFSLEYINRNRTNEEFVKDMYAMYFGREADEAGFNYWVEQLNNNTATREDIMAGFANSEEFFNLCGKYGVTCGTYLVGIPNDQQGGVNSFVARLYKVCLNRLPDQGGQTGWVQKLMNGEVTGSTCAYGFVFSQEFINLNLDNTDFVKYMYNAFFGREADEAGLTYWVEQLNNGTAGREDVFNGFTGSPEFANLCASYGIKA